MTRNRTTARNRTKRAFDRFPSAGDVGLTPGLIGRADRVGAVNRFNQGGDVARVTVVVRDQQGNLVEDEPVELEDRTGGDKALGKSGGDGRVAFFEDVGREPCHVLVVSLPNRPGTAPQRVGCLSGQQTAEFTLTVST